MYPTRKWPLALAVACAFLLGGCGGGGGSSSSGVEPTEGSTDAPVGSGGGTPGDGTGGTPGGDSPVQRTFTAYTITVETPEIVSERVPANNLDHLVAAIAQLVAPYAQAQTAPALRAEDVRVAMMRGDNQGTPDDVSDDTDKFLIRGQDYHVEQSGIAVIVQLPFEPRVDHYIEVAPSGAGGLSAPTYQTELVVDPVGTLVTSILSHRAAQLDQLTPQEVSELLQEVRLLAENPTVSQAIAQAYSSSNSTQALIDALSPHLFAILDASLEDRLAPPVSSEALEGVGGEYYFQSFDLSGFEGIQGKGLAIGGTKKNASLASAGDEKMRAIVDRLASLTYKAMHIYTPYGGTEVHASLNGEAEISTLQIDSRGLTAPRNDQEISCSQPHYWPYTYWVNRKEDCTDRQQQSGRRFLAAGAPTAPFSTLVSSPLSTRQMDDGDGSPLGLRTDSLELGIKKPASIQQLSGEYGVLQINHLDYGGFLRIELALVDATHAGQQITNCQRAFRSLSKDMRSDYPVSRLSSVDNDDCASPVGGSVYTSEASFGNNGAFYFSGHRSDSRGYSSADGLTYLGYSQSPDAEKMTDAGEISWLEGDGAHLMQFAVKRDSSDTPLKNKRYRLMGIGAGASYDTLRTNRILAGTLEFDDLGHPVMQAAEQSEQVLDDDLTESQPTQALNQKFLNVQYQDGRLWMRSDSMSDDLIVETTLQGYVQEGGRVLLLWREETTSEDYNSLGVMVGVCTNCD